jgi:nitrile hydratase accessory protein
VTDVEPEVPFTAPWEGRVFAMAVALVRERGLPWDEFRSRLVAAIDEAPERPYYESWLVALERLAADLWRRAAPGAATPAAAAPADRPAARA